MSILITPIWAGEEGSVREAAASRLERGVQAGALFAWDSRNERMIRCACEYLAIDQNLDSEATFLSSVSFILDPVLLEPDFIFFVCGRTCRVYRETGVDTHLLHQDLRWSTGAHHVSRWFRLWVQVNKKGFRHSFRSPFARYNWKEM